MATRGGMEAAGRARARFPVVAERKNPAGVPAARPPVPPDPRSLWELLETRQRSLRARIAACEQLRAEMSALQAALRAGPGEDPVPGHPPTASRGERGAGP